MKKQNKCVVFVTMSNHGKLQLDGAQMAVELCRTAQGSTGDIDMYTASLNGDNDSMAWRLLRSSCPPNRILCAGTTCELVADIGKLFDDYECVLVEFYGGRTLLKNLIPLKRKYKSRLKIVASVWSYRHGTWRQGLCSLGYFLTYRKYVDMVVFGCPYAARNFTFSSALFRNGRACIMPLSGTADVRQDGADAMNVIREMDLYDLLMDKDSFKLVYMAQLRPIKNHVWLTKALLPVMRENKHIHVIYCGGESGVKKSRILDIAKNGGVAGRVHCPGRIPYEAVPVILRNADCAIIPSISETYGFTYIEPMMFGIPVLGTRVGVGEYAIQDYYNGLTFSLDEPEELCRKVGFLAANRNFTAEMGKNASLFAHETFLMEHVARMRMGLYQRMLSKCRIDA